MSWDDILSKKDSPQKVEPTEQVENTTEKKPDEPEKVEKPEAAQPSTTEETKPDEATPTVEEKNPASVVEEKPKEKVDENKPEPSIWDSVTNSETKDPKSEVSTQKEVEIKKEAIPFNALEETPQQSSSDFPDSSILSKPEFDMKEVTEQSQIVITLYAHKNHGKTSAAFSLPGTIACISFDKKAYPIKVHMNKNDPRIRIYDGIRYLDESDTSIMLDSHVNTFKYILYLLDQLTKDKPDWIVIDATEVLQGICEMVMRARNNFAPFAGVSWTYWKERKVYLKQIHRKAMDACKRGIVYATYVDQNEIIKDGEVFTKIDRPKWTGIQLEETDVVIRITAEPDKSGLHFFASVEGSKVPMFQTGTKKEITGIGLATAFNVS